MTHIAPTLLCFELVHTLVSPLSITVCECIMILFPCAHLFSLSLAGDSHCTNGCIVHTCLLFIIVCECIMIIFSCTHILSLLFEVDLHCTNCMLRCALAFVQIQYQYVSSSCMYLLFQCSSACHVSKSSLCMWSSEPEQILTISFVSFFCFVVTLR